MPFAVRVCELAAYNDPSGTRRQYGSVLSIGCKESTAAFKDAYGRCIRHIEDDLINDLFFYQCVIFIVAGVCFRNEKINIVISCEIYAFSSIVDLFICDMNQRSLGINSFPAYEIEYDVRARSLIDQY